MSNRSTGEDDERIICILLASERTKYLPNMGGEQTLRLMSDVALLRVPSGAVKLTLTNPVD